MKDWLRLQIANKFFAFEVREKVTALELFVMSQLRVKGAGTASMRLLFLRPSSGAQVALLQSPIPLSDT